MKAKHVDVALDEQRQLQVTQQKKEIEENCQYLSRLVDVIKTLAKCNLPLRGHDEQKCSMNQGNFMEMVKLLSRWDPCLKAYLENRPRNAIYLSNRAQNDMIISLSACVLEKIKESVNGAQFFSILMDETADVSSKEQVNSAICIKLLSHIQLL